LILQREKYRTEYGSRENEMAGEEDGRENKRKEDL
jgi:hypothetical protein